jgi:CBS domain-containing protein
MGPSVVVRDVMTASVIAIDPATAVHDARRLMEQHHLSAMPVVDADGRPVGIVSATDLLSNFDPGLPVSRVMTEQVHSIGRDEEIGAAARLMHTHAIHRLVVTGEGREVGIVSALDLLPFIASRPSSVPVPSIGSVMTRGPQVVERDDSLLRARTLMVQHGVRHLAVQHEGANVGIITDRDIKRALDPDLGLPSKEELFVRDVFVPDACEVGPDEPLDWALDRMVALHIGSVLITQRGVLLGILTSTDACRLLAQHLRREAGG